MAADTGTYRLGRNGRGGAETAPPTPPPTPPVVKPGIRGREKEEDREGGRYLPPTDSEGCFSGQNGEYWVCLGGGDMTAGWKRNPTLSKAAAERKHDRLTVPGLQMYPSTNKITQKQDFL